MPNLVRFLGGLSSGRHCCAMILLISWLTFWQNHVQCVFWMLCRRMIENTFRIIFIRVMGLKFWHYAILFVCCDGNDSANFSLIGQVMILKSSVISISLDDVQKRQVAGRYFENFCCDSVHSSCFPIFWFSNDTLQFLWCDQLLPKKLKAFWELLSSPLHHSKCPLGTWNPRQSFLHLLSFLFFIKF